MVTKSGGCRRVDMGSFVLRVKDVLEMPDGVHVMVRWMSGVTERERVSRCVESEVRNCRIGLYFSAYDRRAVSVSPGARFSLSLVAVVVGFIGRI